MDIEAFPLLLGVLALAGHSWFLARRFRLPLYATPAMALGAIVTLLYVSDFFLAMRITAFAMVLSGLGLFAAELVVAVRSGARLSRRRGVLLLALAAGLATLLDLNARAAFSSWDEFSHWGTVAKLVAEQHTFHLKTFGTELYFEDYPPGMALAVYFLIRIAGYSEPAVYFAYAIVLAAALLPMVGLAARGSTGRALVAIVAAYFMVVLLGQGWSSVLIDQVVGVLFGCALCCYLLLRERPPWMLLAIVPVLCFLVLAKQSGNSFVLVVLGIVAADQLLLRWGRTQEPVWLALLAAVMLLWALPTAVNASWKRHVEAEQLRTTFSAVDLRSVRARVRNCCHTDRELAVLTAYFTVFTGRETALPAQPGSLAANAARQLFHPSTGHMLWVGGIHVHTKIVLFLLGLAAAAVLMARGPRLQATVVPALLFGGLAAYALTMLLYYLYVFSDYEARNVTSMTRYLNSFEMGMAMALGGLVLAGRLPARALNAVFTLGALAVLLYIWSRAPVSHHYLALGAPAIGEERAQLRSLAGRATSAMAPRSSVYVLWQAVTPRDTGQQFWQLRHEILPRNTNLACFSVGRKLHPEDIYSCPWDEAELRAALAGYDYVLVGQGLASLQEQYPATFGSSTGADRGMFRVRRAGSDGKQLHDLVPMNLSAP